MSDVTETALPNGRVRCLQPATGYRSAIDPVLLAAAVPARAGQRVLDIGIGTGAAALCLAARVPDVNVIGLEIQAELAALASQGVAASRLQGRIEIIEGDLLDAPPQLVPGAFDHVMANPPFMQAGTGNVPADPSKATATVEGEARLADWLGFAARMVGDGGTVTLIHRTDRLNEITSGLEDRFGGAIVYPLWPGGPAPGGAAKAAKRVIVQARLGVGTPPATTAGLVLHEPDGGFTPLAEAVLRGETGLDLAAVAAAQA